MRRKFYAIIIFSIFCVGAGYLAAKQLGSPAPAVSLAEQSTAANPASPQQTQTAAKQADTNAGNSQNTASSTSAEISQKIQYPVPFVVQAPFANWSDTIFQNACEEASMIMAMGWVNSTKAISAQDAQNQIKSIVAFENKKLGYNADTDINDMQKIFQQYFNYTKISVRENIALPDIKNELQKGNIVLVPAFGQALGNPNYTPPGPVAHMIVIIGYDPAAKEFITNDTGTRHGSGYLYPENTLFDAIWEYPSGSKMPQSPSSIKKKGMLIVQPR
jgi:hypothetical protein